MKIEFTPPYVFPTDVKRSILTEALRQNEIVVTFRKVNGELREMPCTLKPELMPPAPPVVEGAEPRKHPEGVIAVWCTDKQAWRSFRVDSVESFCLTE